MKALELNRRHFLKNSLALGALSALPAESIFAEQPAEKGFKISLAEWSVNRMIRKKELVNMDFPKFAKDLGIHAVEYVDQLFADKAGDESYFNALRKRCSDLGVTSVLIMCDTCGNLGDPDDAKRIESVNRHKPWLEGAKILGCHSIRVNARSQGGREEQEKLAADGLAKLSEVAKPLGLNVIVENHGGLSSDGSWLAGVMKRVNLPNCGTLPDFGNFRVSATEEYDRYKGVTELMPFAKSVSAKTHDFDADGNEIHTDYFKMMDIVLKAGYHSFVGIEYEGSKLGEVEGIKATKALLERVLAKVTAA